MGSLENVFEEGECMLNMSPLEIVRQCAQESGGDGQARTPYFQIKSGERKFLRFLSAAVPTVTVRCPKCGAMYDQMESVFASDRKCMSCGEHIGDEGIVAHRPGVEFARFHKMVNVPSGAGRYSFVCLEDSDNVRLGIVEPGTRGSFGKYACPVCSSPDNFQNGRRRRASMRALAYAVERDVTIEQVYDTQTNQPRMAVTHAEDVMEDGHPRVVIVDMPQKAFWNQVLGADCMTMCISCYDWSVSRTGDGKDTVYSVQNLGDYETYDVTPYEPYMDDLHKAVVRMADPERYVRSGFNVVGYSSQVPAAQAHAQPSYPQGYAAARTQQQGAQFPAQPQPQGHGIPYQQFAQQQGHASEQVPYGDADVYGDEIPF